MRGTARARRRAKPVRNVRSEMSWPARLKDVKGVNEAIIVGVGKKKGHILGTWAANGVSVSTM